MGVRPYAFTIVCRLVQMTCRNIRERIYSKKILFGKSNYSLRQKYWVHLILAFISRSFHTRRLPLDWKGSAYFPIPMTTIDALYRQQKKSIHI